MPVTKVVDKSGRSLNLVSVDGLYASPEFNEYALHNMADFPIRHDDVMLVSYPKSGCHWAWEILRILTHGKISDDKLDKTHCMMEWRRPEDFEALTSPRVLNNHMPFHMQPKAMLTQKPKVVYFYRNFKDVAVSYFYHHSGIEEYGYRGDDFGAYLHRLVDGLVECGNPFQYTRDWEDGMEKHPDLPVICCAYEDMKRDPMSEMRRLCGFLGVDRSDDFLREACQATSFDSMKKTLGVIAPLFCRKGQVGDWANHFTVSQNEWFDRLIKSEMTGSKLKFTYRLPQ